MRSTSSQISSGTVHLKRALYTFKKAFMYTPIPLFTPQTALYTLKIALCTLKIALCTLKRSLYALNIVYALKNTPRTLKKIACIVTSASSLIWSSTHQTNAIDNSKEHCVHNSKERALHTLKRVFSFTPKSPRYTQKCPIYTQKSPTYTQKSLLIHSKEP